MLSNEVMPHVVSTYPFPTPTPEFIANSQMKVMRSKPDFEPPPLLTVGTNKAVHAFAYLGSDVPQFVATIGDFYVQQLKPEGEMPIWAAFTSEGWTRQVDLGGEDPGPQFNAAGDRIDPSIMMIILGSNDGYATAHFGVERVGNEIFFGELEVDEPGASGGPLVHAMATWEWHDA